MQTNIHHPPTNASVFARLRHTPLSDLVRGQVTGRLDVRRAVEDCALPDELAATVFSVARGTRLWRSEQVDVAGELAQHFLDGLAAGRQPGELLAAFGDWRSTARLIRRARRRNRPWPLRAAQRAGQIALILMAVAAGWMGYRCLRAALGRSLVSHNYLEAIEARNLEIVADERAWPLYREALLELPAEPPWIGRSGELPRSPSDEHWAEMSSDLAAHENALELLREGAARGHLGFQFTDAENAAWLAKAGLDSKDLGNLDRALIEVALPQLNALRQCHRWLVADAYRASNAGEAGAALADLTAALAIARQSRDAQPALMSELVRIDFYRRVFGVLAELLATAPDLFTNEQLTELAHRLAAIENGSAMRIDVSGERATFDDLLQRIYSDEGQGRGRMTTQGIEYIEQLMGENLFSASGRDSGVRLLTAAVIADRDETARLFDEIMSLEEREAAKPLWKRMHTPPGEARCRELSATPLSRLRHLPIVIFAPGLQGVSRRAELATQERDALLVAVALRLYHRQRGGWPATLAELVPHWLPEVPVDRFDGQPLRYALRDGLPVLYSVGSDRVDGRGQPSQEASLQPFHLDEPQPEGDWVLWAAQPAAS